MQEFSTDFTLRQQQIEAAIGYGNAFDCQKRPITVAGARGYLYFFTTLSSDELLSDLVFRYQATDVKKPPKTAEEFLSLVVPYGAATKERSVTAASRLVLSGTSLFLCEAFPEGIITDTRALPSRSAEEPDCDRVLYGSRDGFTELLKTNVALLRRRVRSPHFTIKLFEIGEESRTDVALCYDASRADPAYVNKVSKKLSSIKVDALTVGQESLAECLIPQKWYNPFPKFRYTERPDTATATLMEGNLLILCDNSPQIMLLPTSIFDFLQESDDYYFPPIIGTYQRFVRSTIFFITLFFAPLWYMLITHPDLIPESLAFIKVDDRGALPIFFQILIVELLLDGLRLASLNTPSTLGSSLSVVAGLILGDFAVDVGWFIPEVLLYMAFVAISNYSQPSFELGYAFKFMRIFLLVAVGFFGIAGFIGGTLLIIFTIAMNKSLDGSRSYLYPLIPFNGKALLHHLFRTKLKPRK
ncbi:MAG: spore germination protein [Clostridia bacterium]|nr:spore germination protein [Clostridia bacterium]